MSTTGCCHSVIVHSFQIRSVADPRKNRGHESCLILWWSIILVKYTHYDYLVPNPYSADFSESMVLESSAKPSKLTAKAANLLGLAEDSRTIDF